MHKSKDISTKIPLQSNQYFFRLFIIDNFANKYSKNHCIKIGRKHASLNNINKYCKNKKFYVGLSILIYSQLSGGVKMERLNLEVRKLESRETKSECMEVSYNGCCTQYAWSCGLPCM